MYRPQKMCQCPYNTNVPMNNPDNMFQCPYFSNNPMNNPDSWNQLPNQYSSNMNQYKDSNTMMLKDYGPKPFVVNIEKATKQNDNYRTALWTGNHLQVTLMSINVGDDIGLEMHPNLDQFIRIEDGQGLVKMGEKKDKLNFQANVRDNFAIIIPAGTWHNLINTGNKPIKLYSIYAPPQHPFGTIQETKKDAEERY